MKCTGSASKDSKNYWRLHQEFYIQVCLFSFAKKPKFPLVWYHFPQQRSPRPGWTCWLRWEGNAAMRSQLAQGPQSWDLIQFGAGWGIWSCVSKSPASTLTLKLYLHYFTVCPARLWSFPPWRYSKATWTWSWATIYTWPCLNTGVGPDDLQRSFPTSTSLWFCNTLVSHSLFSITTWSSIFPSDIKWNTTYIPEAEMQCSTCFNWKSLSSVD